MNLRKLIESINLLIADGDEMKLVFLLLHSSYHLFFFARRLITLKKLCSLSLIFCFSLPPPPSFALSLR